MGKLADQSHAHAEDRQARRSLAQLRSRRRKLSGELTRLDRQISKAAPQKTRELSVEEFDRWIDELSAGLGHLPPLPADFSGADLYDDHD